MDATMRPNGATEKTTVAATSTTNPRRGGAALAEEHVTHGHVGRDPRRVPRRHRRREEHEPDRGGEVAMGEDRGGATARRAGESLELVHRNAAASASRTATSVATSMAS